MIASLPLFLTLCNRNLALLDETSRLLATIANIGDCRKLLAVAEGVVVAAAREYKAAATMPDVKEDRDRAYQTAVKAGELRLRAESRLGELIKIEQEAGRLASQSKGPTQFGPNNVVRPAKTLKDYGLTLGELIKQEQETGRLAKKGRPEKCAIGVTFLKDIGLTRKDSERAQRVAEH